MKAEPTLFSVAEDLTREITGLASIDEWLEARGIDPLEMGGFIDVFGGGDGKCGLFVQIGYELATRKILGGPPPFDVPPIPPDEPEGMGV